MAKLKFKFRYLLGLVFPFSSLSSYADEPKAAGSEDEAKKEASGELSAGAIAAAVAAAAAAAVVVVVEYIIILIIIIVVLLDFAQLQFCQTVHLESSLFFKPLIFPRKVMGRQIETLCCWLVFLWPAG